MYTTQGGNKRVNFTLAIQRKFANAQGVREADFVPIVAWKQLAETIEKYVYKGMKVSVEGSLQIRQYETQDGQKRTVSEIIADEIEFLSPKPLEGKPEAKPEVKEAKPEFTQEDDDDMPF